MEHFLCDVEQLPVLSSSNRQMLDTADVTDTALGTQVQRWINPVYPLQHTHSPRGEAGEAADNCCNTSRAVTEKCTRSQENTEKGVLILTGEV